jgi:hypothetical protein
MVRRRGRILGRAKAKIVAKIAERARSAKRRIVPASAGAAFPLVSIVIANRPVGLASGSYSGEITKHW